MPREGCPQSSSSICLVHPLQTGPSPLFLCPTGPVANIQHNLREVVRSISCTVDLQIENAKRSWKVSLSPLRKVLKDMVVSLGQGVCAC